MELVLETDMASHFEFLTRFRLKMQVVKATLSRLANAEAADEDVDAALAEDASGDCWMVAKACIRCADIGWAINHPLSRCVAICVGQRGATVASIWTIYQGVGRAESSKRPPAIPF